MSEWPQLNENMISSVTEILKSGKLNQWNNKIVKTKRKENQIVR